jgi:shikimate kinase/3-dehydroquinate synthase
MGAGKSTLGPLLADRLGRAFVSVDAVVEERTGETVAALFDGRGEGAFRQLEEKVALDHLGRRAPSVIEIGGGGLASPATWAALAESAFTLLLETTPEEAWQRVAGTDRPLARDPEGFRALFEERRELYARAADGRARDVDDAVLAAAGIRLGPRDEAAGDAVVADERVAGLYGIEATALVAGGERSKSIAEAERLWRALRLERGSTLVAVGGGTTLDLGGFVAATYLRGISWIAVPTTLVAQVDAAIGGKTAVNLPEGKNLVGAFHQPVAVLADVTTLATLPEREYRAGLGEVAKYALMDTGTDSTAVASALGAQQTAIEARDPAVLTTLVARCAAIKAHVVSSDPLERTGLRATLNYGHTFAHALETVGHHGLHHGEAVAVGLVFAGALAAAMGRIAPEDVVEHRELLSGLGLPTTAPGLGASELLEVMRRDKKASGGLTFVLLGPVGLESVHDPSAPALEAAFRAVGIDS